MADQLNPELIPTPLLDRRRPVHVKPLEKNGGPSLIVTARHAFRYLIAFLRFFSRNQLNSAEHAHELRGYLESLGGMWSKLGQIMGMRRDVFSAGFCDELSLIQDRAFGFPLEEARRAVEETLSRPIEEVFVEFSETPVAAASIAQVHRGRLRANGVEVAIKVLRPDIEWRMRRDLRWLGRALGLLDRIGISAEMRWKELHGEVERSLLEELDFRLEVSALHRMRKTLRPHGIYVPKAFRELCGPRVLVMEYMRGVLMSELIKALDECPDRVEIWLEENRIDPTRVGKTLYHSMQRQSFEDNLFHSDLHPGNIMLFRDSVIGLIDFGAVGSVDWHFQAVYKMHLSAVARGEHGRVADSFALLCQDLPANYSHDEWVNTFVRYQMAHAAKAGAPNITFAERSFGNWLGGMMAEMGRFRASPDWMFLRGTRTEITADISLMYLLPRLDWVQEVRRYEAQASRRGLKSNLGRPPWRRIAVRILDSLGSGGHRGDIDEVLSKLRSPDESLSQRKAAALIAWSLRLVSWALGLSAGVVGLMLLARQAPVATGLPGNMANALSALPPMPATVGFLLAALLLQARAGASRLANLFAQLEPVSTSGRS